MNKNTTTLIEANSTLESQRMIELNDEELTNVSGGWGGWGGGDFDDDYGSRRSSFEKIVVIKRRFSRRRYDYDFDDD